MKENNHTSKIGFIVVITALRPILYYKKWSREYIRRATLKDGFPHHTG